MSTVGNTSCTSGETLINSVSYRESVSYTHLDVYKRQGINNTGNFTYVDPTESVVGTWSSPSTPKSYQYNATYNDFTGTSGLTLETDDNALMLMPQTLGENAEITCLLYTSNREGCPAVCDRQMYFRISKKNSSGYSGSAQICYQIWE